MGLFDLCIRFPAELHWHSSCLRNCDKMIKCYSKAYFGGLLDFWYIS